LCIKPPEVQGVFLYQIAWFDRFPTWEPVATTGCAGRQDSQQSRIPARDPATEAILSGAEATVRAVVPGVFHASCFSDVLVGAERRRPVRTIRNERSQACCVPGGLLFGPARRGLRDVCVLCWLAC